MRFLIASILTLVLASPAARADAILTESFGGSALPAGWITWGNGASEGGGSLATFGQTSVAGGVAIDLGATISGPVTFSFDFAPSPGEESDGGWFVGFNASQPSQGVLAFNNSQRLVVQYGGARPMISAVAQGGTLQYVTSGPDDPIPGQRTFNASTFAHIEGTLNPDGSATVTTTWNDGGSPASVTYSVAGASGALDGPRGTWFAIGNANASYGPDYFKNLVLTTTPAPPPPPAKTPAWSRVTIPGLPAEASIQDVWARGRNDTFALVFDPMMLMMSIWHWNGAGWERTFETPTTGPGFVYGTGASDLFATNTNGSNGELWHSTDDGATWTRVALSPPQGYCGRLTGFAGNVQFIGGSAIYQWTGGTTANEIFGDTDVYTLTLLSPNEGYYISCFYWGKWDGSSWTYHSNGFDFCDAYRLWGVEDATSGLNLYAGGNNNFSNGVRVWRFDDAAQSFGSKFGFVFGDPESPGGIFCGGGSYGYASGIWGSGASDVYVAGTLALGETPGNCGPRTGRLYHFDGSAWTHVAAAEALVPAGAEGGHITGSAADDLWMGLGDGSLLHYGPPPAPDTNFGYAVNNGDGTVSVFSTLTRQVTATIAVGSQPRAVAFLPDGSRAYVANAGDGTVSVIDPSTQTVIGTIAVGSQPSALAATLDGKKVYVCDAGNYPADPGDVSIIDVATGAVSLLAGAKPNPSSIAMKPDGSEVWIGYNNNADGIQSFEASSGALLEPFGANSIASGGIAFLPDSSIAYTVEVCGCCGSYHEVVTSSLAVSDVNYAPGGETYSVATVADLDAPNADTVYLGSIGNCGGGPAVASYAGGEVTSRLPFSGVGFPASLAMSRDGSLLYSADVGASGSVSVIDARDLSLVATIPVGAEPLDVKLFPGASADATPPVTTLTLPALPAAGYYLDTVTASFSAVDEAGGSGVAKITWSLDGGAQNVIAGASGTVTISTPGAHTLSYGSVDVAGNIEAMKSATFTLKATTTISWPSPAAIAFGTPLSDAQLDAGASAPGTLTYTPPAGTVLGVGAGQTLSVTFTPDDAATYAGASASVTIDVVPATITTLTASQDSLVFGEAVTLRAKVVASPKPKHAPVPSGSIAFFIDGAEEDVTLSASGVASLKVTGLLVGSHSIVATYGGDGVYGAGDPATLTETVSQASTTTTLTDSPTAAVFGENVTLRVRVRAVAPGAGTPDGTVILSIDGAPQTLTLAAGLATFPTSTLTVGDHTISASYGGDDSFLGSDATMLTLTVSKAATTSTLTESPSTAVFSQPVTLRIRVRAQGPGRGSPTGAATITVNGAPFPVTIDPTTGLASVVVSNLAVSTPATGPHTIGGGYSGDDSFLASDAAPIALVVNPSPTKTTLSLSKASVVSGEAATITVQVRETGAGSGTPGGQVAIVIDGGAPQVVTLVGGAATLPAGALAVTSHVIAASYLGDGGYAPSDAASVTLTVKLAATKTTLGASANPATTSQKVTLTATVAVTAPGAGATAGTVTFQDGTTLLGAVAVDGTGTATLQVTGLAVATHAVTATYSGSAALDSSVGKLSLKITK